MTINNKIFNGYSEDEEDQDLEEEQSQEDDDVETEDQDEDDEVDDNDDFVEEKMNLPKKADTGNTVVISRQSLGGGNKKIVLKSNSNKARKKLVTKKLVDEAIQHLNERSGSSMEAIKKYIMNINPEIEEKRLKIQMKRYIKRCLVDGTMVQIKRSFKLSNKHMTKLKEKEKEKAKAKKEKEKEKERLAKEKQKQKKTEQLKEKQTKATPKEKPADKPKDKPKMTNPKDKPKTTKRPKDGEAGAKAKPTKKVKLDEPGKLQKPTVDTNTSMMKLKSKNKLSRKSINFVVRPTPPRPKTMKKTKPTREAVTKKKIDFKDAVTATSTGAVVKVTGRGKRK